MLRAVILHESCHHEVRRGTGLFQVCARLQASHHEDRCIAAIGKDFVASRTHQRQHRHRHKSAQRRAPARAHKLGLRHAHHGKRQAVDLHKLADDMRVGGKAALPCLVGQNDDRIRAHRPPLIGQEEPPQHGLRAQHREVVAADHMHKCSIGGFACAAQLDCRLQVGHNPGKRPRHLWKFMAIPFDRSLKIQKIRI